MKPPEEMTDEELRIEIAEFCGYEARQTDYKTWAGYKDNQLINIKLFDCERDIINIYFPNYPQDLNAMWEAEEKFTLNQMCAYSKELHKLKQHPYQDLGLIHATAKQRAIAFVKTIREIKK